jgi:hypothetical protein
MADELARIEPARNFEPSRIWRRIRGLGIGLIAGAFGCVAAKLPDVRPFSVPYKKTKYHESVVA